MPGSPSSCRTPRASTSWALVLFVAAALAVLRFKFSALVTLLTFSALGIALVALGIAK